MKMRDPHIVPLSRQAIDVLTQLLAINGEQRFVFYSVQGRSHISNNTMLYALYRMGYKSRMTGHGFRGLAATALRELGYSRDVVERQMAHAERNQVTAAYVHAEYLPERRKMMQRWADYLDELKVGQRYCPSHHPMADCDFCTKNGASRMPGVREVDTSMRGDVLRHSATVLTNRASPATNNSHRVCCALALPRRYPATVCSRCGSGVL